MLPNRMPLLTGTPPPPPTNSLFFKSLGFGVGLQLKYFNPGSYGLGSKVGSLQLTWWSRIRPLDSMWGSYRPCVNLYIYMYVCVYTRMYVGCIGFRVSHPLITTENQSENKMEHYMETVYVVVYNGNWAREKLGYHFGDPNNEDSRTWRSILGSPYLWKLRGLQGA